MVLNILKPVASASFGRIQTKREQTYSAGYAAGNSAGRSHYAGTSKEHLLAEAKAIRKKMRKVEREHDKTSEDLRLIDRFLMADTELKKWASDYLTFEKPTGGAVATLRADFNEKRVLSAHEIIAKIPVQSFEEVFEEAEVFRVEHDWFKAIRKAEEFESGSFRLPYEVSIFEFKISRKDVVAICTNYASDTADNEIVMQLAAESWFGWTLSHNLYRHNGGHWDVLQAGQSLGDDPFSHLVHLIGDQIRAACIALDAKVATANRVREAHLGETSDTKSHPSYEFYTIGIAKRERADVLGGGGDTKGVRRMHFRRGHWRHYSTFKTWVRWALVGNPELGFIDKQYRL